MSKLKTAYELGKRQAIQEHMEKEALFGVLRGAGSLIARGARAGYGAASPHVSKGVAAARNSGSFRNIARQSKYIAKDTLKSPMTYVFGGLSAYNTEGSAWDKTKAALIGGGIGMGSYKLMGGAANRVLGTGMRMSGANRSRFTSDLMSRGLSKTQANRAVINRNMASRYAKSGDIANYDKYMSKYKDSLKDLTFKQKLGLGLKYDKARMALGTTAFVGSGFAAEKATGAMFNMAGVGEQQQNRMYEDMSRNYPPPPPMRAGTIAGNNNPYSR